MLFKRHFCLGFASFFALGGLLAAQNSGSSASEAWKNKQVAEWSEDDARQVLADSPWVRTVTPTIGRNDPNQSRPGGYGNRGGFGFPGGGIGFPGGGGMGRRGGGYPQGGQTDDPRNQQPAPMLTVRWESALPVREAELKTRDVNAPTLEDDAYAIAVYGVPSRMMGRDPDRMANELKGQASIKRHGKKDLKPSGVRILDREDGPVVVFLFPKSKEITSEDRRLEFDAKIGRLEFTQSFYPEDMMFLGKLEL